MKGNKKGSKNFFDKVKTIVNKYDKTIFLLTHARMRQNHRDCVTRDVQLSMAWTSESAAHEMASFRVWAKNVGDSDSLSDLLSVFLNQAFKFNFYASREFVPML